MKKKFYKDYYLIKTTYANNNRIALSLQNMDVYYTDITINIPNILLEENEIILNNDLCDLADKFEELGLYEIVNIVPYNYGRYMIAELNTDILNKYAIEIKEV